jgi:hypothetical protein
MDPLRPFSNLIRSLSKSGATHTRRAQGGTEAGRASTESTGSADTAAEPAPPSLRSEIRDRMRQIDLGDRGRVRQVFVETVIARELGLGATQAAEVAGLAEQIAAQIGSHPRLSDRLHTLLTALAEEPAAG